MKDSHCRILALRTMQEKEKEGCGICYPRKKLLA